jgi:hypothetical protein
MRLANKYIRQLDERLSTTSSESDIMETIRDIVSQGNPEKETMLVRYSNIRDYFKTRYMHFAYSLCCPPEQLVSDVKVIRSQKLNKRDNIEVDARWIDTIETWDNSTDVYKWVALAQLRSGRRINEIVGSTFELSPTEGYIECRNLSKKRYTRKYKFPILGSSPEEWLELIEDIRNELPSDYKVNTLTKLVNRRIQRIDPSLTSHKMRGLYAFVLWNRSGKKQNQTGFIKDVLCLDSQNVAMHYACYVSPNKFDI